MEINKDLKIGNTGTTFEDLSKILEFPELSEQKIGTFYNGETIYRQTFVFQLNPTYREGDKSYMWYNTNISFRHLLNIYGHIGSGSNYIYPVNVDGVCSVCLRGSSIQVGVLTGAVVNQWLYIVLEYTRN